MECKKNAEINDYKVSVIVPVYNVEDYLEECVNSLVGQTLEDIEILLIDDGSTDLSGVMCDGYAEKYPNVSVIHKTNGGLGDARNVGTRVAKGKYIYFIDSDDLLEKCALQYLYDEAEKKYLDVVLFSAECFTDEKDFTFDKEQYKRTSFLNEVMSGTSLFEKLYLVHEYYASIPLRFYNRKYFVENNYTFPDIIHEDEFPGFISLIFADRAECLAYRFYKRRFRKGSIMTSKKAYNSSMGYLYTWKELIVACEKIQSENKEIYVAFTNDFLKLVMNLYYTSFDKDEKKNFKNIRYEIQGFINQNCKGINKGIRLFMISPYIYKQYKRIVKIMK